MLHRKLLAPFVLLMDCLFLVVSVMVLMTQIALISSAVGVHPEAWYLKISIIVFTLCIGVVSAGETVLQYRQQRYVLATLYSVIPVAYWILLNGVIGLV